MTKVKVGALRNQLSKYLQKVRRGMEVVITQRDIPIGRLVPYLDPAGEDPELALLPPPKGYGGLARFLAEKPRRGIHYDAVAALLEERRRR